MRKRAKKSKLRGILEENLLVGRNKPSSLRLNSNKDLYAWDIRTRQQANRIAITPKQRISKQHYEDSAKMRDTEFVRHAFLWSSSGKGPNRSVILINKKKLAEKVPGAKIERDFNHPGAIRIISKEGKIIPLKEVANVVTLKRQEIDEVKSKPLTIKEIKDASRKQGANYNKLTPADKKIIEQDIIKERLHKKMLRKILDSNQASKKQ